MSGRERMKLGRAPAANALPSECIADSARLLRMMGRGELRFQKSDLIALAAALHDNAQQVEALEVRATLAGRAA